MREREQGTAQGVLLHHGAAERGGGRHRGSARGHGGMVRQCHCCRHSDDVTFLENPPEVFKKNSNLVQQQVLAI